MITRARALIVVLIAATTFAVTGMSVCAGQPGRHDH